MGREHEPTPGQWYENREDDDAFQVVSVDADTALIELQYVDGDIEEIDYETWQEMDLELTEEPEGWTGGDEDEDDEEDEEDDDWDEDDEEDDDWDEEDDEEDEDEGYGDRPDY